MKANDDEGIPIPLTSLFGEAAAFATRGGDDIGVPNGPKLDVSSQDSQPCASVVSEATSCCVFASINNLREIMGQCFDGKPLDGDLAEWLGAAIDGYLTRQFRTLEEALGLIFPRGGIPWWREEAMRKRDAALRALADSFLGDLAPCVQARQIWTLAQRYAASSWRFDQDNGDMPANYEGTVKQSLWQAVKSGAPMPIGERQLRNVLAH